MGAHKTKQLATYLLLKVDVGSTGQASAVESKVKPGHGREARCWICFFAGVLNLYVEAASFEAV